MTTQQLISRDFHGTTIRQRSDGYLNATDMCKVNGKHFKHYMENQSTSEFINALSLKVGIPTFKIIEIKLGRYGGSWIHPKASIHLAMWCSPEFAVTVSEWVYELLTKGSVSLDPNKSAKLVQAKSDELSKLDITGNAKRNALNNFIKERFGYDTLAMFEMESQVAEIQQALLIPSSIAKRVGLSSARPVNVKLTKFGLQTNHRDHKNYLYYELTEKGKKYGQYQDFTTGKISRRKIEWYESVLKLFPPALAPKKAPLSTLQLF